MVSSLDDNALYTLYRDCPQGEGREAFDELARRHQQRLKNRMCRALYKMKTAAEDIVQNVFMSLMQQAHKFDPARHDVVGWMNWLADNRARNEKRDRFRRPATETDFFCPGQTATNSHPMRTDEMGIEGGNHGDSLEVTLLTREQSPEFGANREELIDAFWTYVDTLEPKFRDTLVLLLVDGLSPRELVKALGIDRSTVLRRLKMLLPKLRAAVGDEVIDARRRLERRATKRAVRIPYCA